MSSGKGSSEREEEGKAYLEALSQREALLGHGLIDGLERLLLHSGLPAIHLLSDLRRWERDAFGRFEGRHSMSQLKWINACTSGTTMMLISE